MKLEATRYSQLSEYELKNLISEALSLYIEHRNHIKVGCGLSIQDAIMITRCPVVAAFFEGMAIKIALLDISGKCLTDDDKISLCQRVATNIIQDSEFRKYCKKHYQF